MKYIYLSLMVFIALSVSAFQVSAAEQKACTKEYAPVCGEVQVQCIRAPCPPIKETFGNRCELDNRGAIYLYVGECLGNIDEYRFGKAFNNLMKKYFGDYSEAKLASKYQEIYKRTQDPKISVKNSSLVRYVGYLTAERLHKEILEPHIRKNVRDIVEIDAVLGGTWYITDIVWHSFLDATIYFEDGHFAENQEVSIEITSTGFTVQ